MRISGDMYTSDIRIYDNIKCYLRTAIYSDLNALTEICNIIAAYTGSKNVTIDKVMGLDVIRFSVPENTELLGYAPTVFWLYETINFVFHNYIAKHPHDINQGLLEFDGFYNLVQAKCIGEHTYEIILL